MYFLPSSFDTYQEMCIFAPQNASGVQLAPCRYEDVPATPTTSWQFYGGYLFSLDISKKLHSTLFNSERDYFLRETIFLAFAGANYITLYTLKRNWSGFNRNRSNSFYITP